MTKNYDVMRAAIVLVGSLLVHSSSIAEGSSNGQVREGAPGYEAPQPHHGCPRPQFSLVPVQLVAEMIFAADQVELVAAYVFVTDRQAVDRLETAEARVKCASEGIGRFRQSTTRKVSELAAQVQRILDSIVELLTDARSALGQGTTKDFEVQWAKFRAKLDPLVDELAKLLVAMPGTLRSDQGAWACSQVERQDLIEQLRRVLRADRRAAAGESVGGPVWRSVGEVVEKLDLP